MKEYGCHKFRQYSTDEKWDAATREEYGEECSSINLMEEDVVYVCPICLMSIDAEDIITENEKERWDKMLNWDNLSDDEKLDVAVSVTKSKRFEEFIYAMDKIIKRGEKR